MENDIKGTQTLNFTYLEDMHNFYNTSNFDVLLFLKLIVLRPCRNMLTVSHINLSVRGQKVLISKILTFLFSSNFNAFLLLQNLILMNFLWVNKEN